MIITSYSLTSKDPNYHIRLPTMDYRYIAYIFRLSYYSLLANSTHIIANYDFWTAINVAKWFG